MSWAEENATARPFAPHRSRRKPKEPAVVSHVTKEALNDLDSVDTLEQFEALKFSRRTRW